MSVKKLLGAAAWRGLLLAVVTLLLLLAAAALMLQRGLVGELSLIHISEPTRRS